MVEAPGTASDRRDRQDPGLAVRPDARKFDLAYQLLLEAERAVDALGDASEGSAEIRRGAEEAAIFGTRSRTGWRRSSSWPTSPIPRRGRRNSTRFTRDARS